MPERYGAPNFGRVADYPVVVDDEGRWSGRPQMGQVVPLAVREQRFGQDGHPHTSVPLPDEGGEERLVVGAFGHRGQRASAGDLLVQPFHPLRKARPQPGRCRRGVEQQEAAAHQPGLPMDSGGDHVGLGQARVGQDGGQRVAEPHEVHLEEQDADSGLDEAQHEARPLHHQVHVARLAVLLRPGEARVVHGHHGDVRPRVLQALTRGHVGGQEEHVAVDVAQGRRVAQPAGGQVEVGVVEDGEQHHPSPLSDDSRRAKQLLLNLTDGGRLVDRTTKVKFVLVGDAGNFSGGRAGLRVQRLVETNVLPETRRPNVRHGRSAAMPDEEVEQSTAAEDKEGKAFEE